ncbi:hypothetical protein P8452_19346 [Trifolium repens]|nr:hypothetical protein P8452_19346 [Trifolium repens]
MLGFNVKSIWLMAILAMSLCHYQNVSGEDCENDIMAFNIECMIFMNKDLPKPINPNDRCCNVIRRANVPCDSLFQVILLAPTKILSFSLLYLSISHFPLFQLSTHTHSVIVIFVNNHNITLQKHSLIIGLL